MSDTKKLSDQIADLRKSLCESHKQNLEAIDDIYLQLLKIETAKMVADDMEGREGGGQ